jgi:N-acetylmuramoyl-L-alanine amidase
MSNAPVCARRLLLSHGVAATMLLPAWAATAATRRRDQHPPPVRESRQPVPVVMLDAGHGGKDPGAIGYSGTYEKHVAISTALELRRLLEASGRYRVVLTRQRDIFIPLEDRVAMAEKAGAHLFVSMHADALNDHEVRGASVYTLSATASDPQTAQLAQRENSADRFEGPTFRGVSPDVARILASLVRQETRIDSARMASSVVGALDHTVPMLTNPDRHAGFVVLKSVDIPSVLVEMGFMSNPQDEAALRRPEHRAKVATAMKRAVDGYFAMADRVTRVAG